MSDKYPDEIIDLAAKALWDSKPHTLLRKHGYPTEWENQETAIKRDVRRNASIVANILIKAQRRTTSE